MIAAGTGAGAKARAGARGEKFTTIATSDAVVEFLPEQTRCVEDLERNVTQAAKVSMLKG